MRVSDEEVERLIKSAEIFKHEGTRDMALSYALDLKETRATLRAAQETLTREHAALVDYHGDHNEADCETCALIARIADAATEPPLHAQG